LLEVRRRADAGRNLSRIDTSDDSHNTGRGVPLSAAPINLVAVPLTDLEIALGMKKHFVRVDVAPQQSRIFRYPLQRRRRVGLQTRELNRLNRRQAVAHG